MGAGTNLQVEIRLRQLQMIEEHLRHAIVVVLAGVNENFVMRHDATRD